MKNSTFFKFLFFAVIVSAVFTSCGEDEPDKPVVTGDALFTYVADGFDVTFTNTSTVSGTTTSSWDFGDGESSADKSPVHSYAGKGEYTVKLTVTDADAGTHDVTTKVSVDKSTRISLEDNSFDDWDKVTEDKYKVTLGDNSGVITSVVYDYDADNVYGKMTFEGALTDSVILNVFIDSDADLTGFSSALWPLFGVDYLMQGQVTLGADSWFGSFLYSGADHGWGWTDEGLSDFYTVGNIEEGNGQVTFEIAFDRAKVPGMNADEIKIIMYLANKGWSEIGFAPDKFVDGGDPTDGFTLKMN